jgi:predicted Rossmann fold flavoprotein
MKKQLNVAVIGGGAAGFFSALSVKEHYPDATVILFEKSTKLLSKVKVSGGGRCNVTHACFDNKELSKFYPRGEKFLRKAFEQFNTTSILEWLEKRGVLTDTLPDNCIFPKSNSSQTIIDCFLLEARKLGIEILMNTEVQISREKDVTHFTLTGKDKSWDFDKVIIAIGGQPKYEKLLFLEKLGHKIVTPLPSLFTFNMPGNEIVSMMGNVVEHTTVKVEGTKLVANGPLLITHWGMSGPSILKLSAWGARILAEKNYQFAVIVNWLNAMKEVELRTLLSDTQLNHGAKKITNLNPFPITNRLWHFLLNKAQLSPESRWQELGAKSLNKIVTVLLFDRHEVKGKTTFKEEFVTAGGVSLEDINPHTMESKVLDGMYFAGEVMDIDGITGGFNFQAAWTSAWIAGKLNSSL